MSAAFWRCAARYAGLVNAVLRRIARERAAQHAGAFARRLYGLVGLGDGAFQQLRLVLDVIQIQAGNGGEIGRQAELFRSAPVDRQAELFRSAPIDVQASLLKSAPAELAATVVAPVVPPSVEVHVTVAVVSARPPSSGFAQVTTSPESTGTAPAMTGRAGTVGTRTPTDTSLSVPSPITFVACTLHPYVRPRVKPVTVTENTDGDADTTRDVPPSAEPHEIV